jgi:hypothetical protein
VDDKTRKTRVMSMSIYQSMLSSNNDAFLHLWTSSNALVEPFLVFVGEFFEGLALGLGNKERREDTRKHEEGEDLQTGMIGLGFKL